MQVTVKIRPQYSEALHDVAAAGPAIGELLQIVEERGLSLEPEHPGETDPLLTPYFRVEVPDEAAAEDVSAALRTSEAVEAAYVKPADELP
jgi:hypothetical protein